MISEALEFIVRGLVDNPGDVQIIVKPMNRGGTLLQVRTNPDDYGRLIGRQGRTINAVRKVISALAKDEYVRVDILDREES